MTVIDRVLFSDSAQKSVLGAAIEDNSLVRGALAGLAVNDWVGTEGKVFAEMLRLSEDGQPFDVKTLAEELGEGDEAARVAWAVYLASLTDGVVLAEGIIRRHVEVIQRLSGLRRLALLGENLVTDAAQLGADPDALLEKTATTIRSLQGGHDLNGHLLPCGPRDLSRRPELLTLSRVDAKKVQWLWEPYLPIGMLAMLSGDPGVGKTYVALDIGAAVTSGRVPASGEPREPGDVLYLSVENSPEYVLRPRFDLLGGDPDRFHILQGSIVGSTERPERRSVRLTEVAILGSALLQTRARLVIVDPIQSFLGAEVDAHRSNETRPVMDGLSRLAEEHSCCILLVRHLSKAQSGRAIHRGLGSIDFTGAVRTELLAGCSADDSSQRALVPVKSNLGQFGRSLGYVIEASGMFRWTGESQLTASAIFAPESGGEETGAIPEAKDLLSRLLSPGPRLAADVQREADQEGVSARTLKRAKKELKILCRKQGMNGPWEWSLSQEGQK